MALSDPITIALPTLALASTPFPRIDSGNNGARYRYVDGYDVFDLQVSHAYGRRDRIVARLDAASVSPNPVSGDPTQVSGSVYTVFDFPKFGWEIADKAEMHSGLSGLLTASSSAIAKRILGGES